MDMYLVIPASSTDPLGLCAFRIALLPGRNSALNDESVAQTIQNQIIDIFGAAGVGIEFAPTDVDFTLVVANQVPSGVKISDEAIGSTGVTNGVVDNRGYVYSSRLEQFDMYAAQNSNFLAVGLGRAGAHEIGHSLLQQIKHSKSGLMQRAFKGPAWHLMDKNTIEQFLFLPDQAKRLRAECDARRRAGGGARRDPQLEDVPWWMRQMEDFMSWVNSIQVESVHSTIYW
jgi:hypothetical protein